MERELYLLKRELDKIDETIKNIEKEFGKQYTRQSLIQKRNALKDKIDIKEYTIKYWKKGK